MSGMGGSGLGAGFGASGGGGALGGGKLTAFGFKGPGGLRGTLYDLKQYSSDRGPTGIKAYIDQKGIWQTKNEDKEKAWEIMRDFSGTGMPNECLRSKSTSRPRLH
jgi:hypothetical protein